MNSTSRFSRFCWAHSRSKDSPRMTALHMIHIDAVGVACNAAEHAFTNPYMHETVKIYSQNKEGRKEDEQNEMCCSNLNDYSDASIVGSKCFSNLRNGNANDDSDDVC